jgi:hypothetical protein
VGCHRELHANFSVLVRIICARCCAGCADSVPLGSVATALANVPRLVICVDRAGDRLYIGIGASRMHQIARRPKMLHIERTIAGLTRLDREIARLTMAINTFKIEQLRAAVASLALAVCLKSRFYN